MLPQEIIRRKRDDHALDEEAIRFFVERMTSGEVTEGQIAALGMAIFFRGMSREETALLTRAMADSGDTLDWDLPGPVVDKHSTGGVGDLVSLVLGPMLAECGGFVPMISGRGLGHTGGTLDKLESIPGYNALPDKDVFRRVVREAGVAIIGQTGDLAPADRTFYAVRDVTATVESIPLITASILSKKLAAGLDRLVMDVKTGNGAFMTEHGQALALAESIVHVADKAGLPTTALVTDMNEPLAPCAGNGLEVAEAVRYLTGEARDVRLDEVVMALGSAMLRLCGLVDDEETAVPRLRQALDGGGAAERFGRMVAGLGGPEDFIERYESYLPMAQCRVAVLAPRRGYVTGWNTRQLGLAVLAQGGGRTRPQDGIDHAVGITEIVKTGTFVEVGDPLAVLHGSGESVGLVIKNMVVEAADIGEEEPARRLLIHQEIRSDSAYKE